MIARVGQVACIALYSLVLLLVLRFCGRSYPGLYFPDSAFLNGLLNGNFLFTELGYDLAVVGAVAGTARIFMPGDSPKQRQLRWWLGVAQAATVALVIATICYGLWWANGMQRLPWQPDAEESDYRL